MTKSLIQSWTKAFVSVEVLKESFLRHKAASAVNDENNVLSDMFKYSWYYSQLILPSENTDVR